MGRRRLGVVLLVPDPVRREIDGLRRALGAGSLGRVPAHLTLVPPVNVREDDLEAGLRHLGDVGQDDHPVVLDRDEASVHGDQLVGPLAWAHGDRLDLERAEEGRVAGQEGDVASTDRAGDDHLGLALVEDPLRRDELDLQRHPATSRWS
jgi:hypothetical protein